MNWDNIIIRCLICLIVGIIIGAEITHFIYNPILISQEKERKSLLSDYKREVQKSNSDTTRLNRCEYVLNSLGLKEEFDIWQGKK